MMKKGEVLQNESRMVWRTRCRWSVVRNRASNVAKRMSIQPDAGPDTTHREELISG